MTNTVVDAVQRSKISRAAWPFIIGAALAISWWSLYVLAHEQYGMPKQLAVVVSTVYDGGALVLADLSQRYARTPDSGMGPRILMIALIGVSAWLNWSHARMLHYTAPGQVMFASPPVVAGALFEIEQRFMHRDALRRFGRVAPALPAFGRWSWTLHPVKTIRRVYAITAHRVDSVPVDIMDLRPIEAPHGAPDTPADGAPGPLPAPQFLAPRPIEAPHGAPAPLPPLPAPREADGDGAPRPITQSSTPELPAAPRPAPANGAPAPQPEQWFRPTVVDQDDATEDAEDDGPDTETFARIDWGGDLAKLDAAEPPAWSDLSKAEAVRRCMAILPDLSASQTADLLKAKGVQVTAAYVRNARSRNKANGAVIPMRQRGAAS
jgi:hypothetical protein